MEKKWETFAAITNLISSTKISRNLRGRLEAQKSVIVYKIVNEKMAKLIKDQHVYRVAELNTQIYLVSKEWGKKNRIQRDKETHCKKNLKFFW